MTVYTTKPAINLREELASLKNQGGYSEQQFYFDSLVTNGDFATATTGWNAGTNSTLSIVSAALRVTSTSTTAPTAYQVITTAVGKSYTVSADILTGSATRFGRLLVGNSASNGALYTGGYAVSTTQTATFVATSVTTYLTLMCNTTTSTEYMDFDNVSVYDSDGTDAIYTMSKGWVPKDVFEDGLLQREGAANDYTVVYDGFDYYVKPVVAPSATTQTCVIGVRA